MKKKRKGASLVVVVVMTSIIFALAMAILGMAVMGYKARANQSKGLQNMYGSDSGLDVMYNIIIKSSNAAIVKSGKDVEKTTDEDQRNEDFKKGFINYLDKDFEVKVADSDAKEKWPLQKCMMNWKYMECSSDGVLSLKDVDKNDAVITVEVTKEDDYTLKVKVISSFQSTTGQFANKKTIQADYTIDAPDYNDVMVDQGQDIVINPVYDGKIITADGDMTSTGNVDVDGDIWVKGKGVADLNDQNSAVNNKYKGGITISDGKYNQINNIYTNSTLDFQTKVTSVMDGSIYSSNTYVGNTDKNSTSISKDVTLSNADEKSLNIITNNDLALNSNNGVVNITNYYGINDKTIEPDNKNDVNLAARESSSIIVNNVDSKLAIANDAYIMGLAYLDVNTDSNGAKYKTGESVAIKGNYAAYTDPMDNKNVQLRYYNPLQLIDSIDGEKLNKTDQFIKYYDKNALTLPDGGIYLKNVYAVGAYIQDNKAKSDSVEKQTQAILDMEPVKRDYAKNVFCMGHTYFTEANDIKKINEINKKIDALDPDASDYEDKKEDYEKEYKEVEEPILNNIYKEGNVIRSVDTQIRFASINDEDNSKVITDYGKAILRDDTDTITIKKDGKVTISSNGKSPEVIDFGTEDMHGLIVTRGTVNVEAGVKFTGNIITKGNVKVNSNNGSEDIKLVYDKDTTQKIYAANKEYFNKVFILPSDKVVHVNIKSNLSAGIDGYYEKDYVKKGVWKIVKGSGEAGA